jgi:hypothetical protein
MSEPLRFKPVNPAHEMIYSPDGGWVSWEDYARLKAEVERLTAFTTRTIIPNEELQAQVERLTKAGDAMELTLQADFNGRPYEPLIIVEVIHRWRYAKENPPHA